jgi:thiazole synthase
MSFLKVNGKVKEFEDDFPQTVSELLKKLNINPSTIAAEVDGQIIHKDHFADTRLSSGQTVELVRFVGGGQRGDKDYLQIADKRFSSRLLVGTGKFPSYEVLEEAIQASGTQIVTAALRRVNIEDENDDMLSAIDREKYLLLMNTSGARDAGEAVRLAKLSRAATGIEWVKLEVTPDPYYLLPDPVETLKAAEQLVNEGFVVLPYINADPVLAKRLEDIGTPAVMPLGSPIGSNQGLKTRPALEIIIEQANVPVIVDAGIGLPSHASDAMEMGADAVLVNTAIATAGNPVQMAKAFRQAVQAGRTAYIAGQPSAHKQAKASSPLTGFLREE